MAQGAVKKSGKRSQAVSAKKEAILAAALEAFSQFGIHGTRLEQVAERAGVSKTNLLYYYPSKEALYVAVLQQILAIWLAPLKASTAFTKPLPPEAHTSELGTMLLTYSTPAEYWLRETIRSPLATLAGVRSAYQPFLPTMSLALATEKVRVR